MSSVYFILTNVLKYPTSHIGEFKWKHTFISIHVCGTHTHIYSNIFTQMFKRTYTQILCTLAHTFIQCLIGIQTTHSCVINVHMHIHTGWGRHRQREVMQKLSLNS